MSHLQIPRNGCVIHDPSGTPIGVVTHESKSALLHPNILVRIPPRHVGVVWIDGMPHSSWMHPAELTTA
jgi:hypothetical protein